MKYDSDFPYICFHHIKFYISNLKIHSIPAFVCLDGVGKIVNKGKVVDSIKIWHILSDEITHCCAHRHGNSPSLFMNEAWICFMIFSPVSTWKYGCNKLSAPFLSYILAFFFLKQNKTKPARQL